MSKIFVYFFRTRTGVKPRINPFNVNGTKGRKINLLFAVNFLLMNCPYTNHLQKLLDVTDRVIGLFFGTYQLNPGEGLSQKIKCFSEIVPITRIPSRTRVTHSTRPSMYQCLAKLANSPQYCFNAVPMYLRPRAKLQTKRHRYFLNLCKFS